MTTIFDNNFKIELPNCKEILYYNNELVFDINGDILLNNAFKTTLFIDLEGNFEFLNNLKIGRSYEIQLNQFFSFYGDKTIDLGNLKTKKNIIIISENKKYSINLLSNNLNNFSYKNNILSGPGVLNVLIQPLLTGVLYNFKKNIDKAVFSFFVKI